MKFGRWQWTFWRRFQRTSLFGGLEMTVARDPFPTRVGPKYHCFLGWLRVISEIWRIKTCFVLVLAPHQQRFFYPHSCSVFLLRSCLWCSLSTEPVCSRPKFKTKIFSGRHIAGYTLGFLWQSEPFPWPISSVTWHFLPCWVVPKDWFNRYIRTL